MKKPKISVLISARRNSKYLAKFIFGLMRNTNNIFETEVLVMLNKHDTWNDECGRFFSLLSQTELRNESGFQNIRFFKENKKLGRAGLHEYFNELVEYANGDWIIYFCEDHFINYEKWDKYVLDIIAGKKLVGDSAGKQFPLNPAEPWVIVPKFDNCGAMNHIVSRGFINALGGVIGRHGWIDSYINDLMVLYPDRVIRTDEALFHDFTHDDPSPMSEAHCQSLSTEKGKLLPAYDSDVVRAKIKEDQEKINKSLGR